ncbi:sirohydrochlorin cobaltochelatase [Parabacteroides sp. ZJ-118]|uniref:sirohydrochlorin cobaltochelatase n=1 Tax=Parabacteroides sp. ZJ-118 TaxID=2709398 RepID=UPI0013EA70FA|nr:sirohydrochlorin cobaltochelatase [Parabacteroides sp. ZJ-118]
MEKHLLSFFLLIISLVCRAHDGDNFVVSDLFASLQPGDKPALLMVHFGTTHDDTRALTIDVINQKAKEAFKDVEVREAWTSRIVMRRLKARGVKKLNPIEALEKLKVDGYTHILIQSTNIIEGLEMESLRREVAAMQSSFKEIRIGNPLLYAVEDYEAVIAAITKNGAKEDATVLVGHGTYTPATAQYAMLDYMLKEKGFKHYSVGTIEGYPSFDAMEAQLKANGMKKVLLMPFMFVAGDHAKNDIAGDWKEELEKRGYEVSLFMEGLGQHPDIQDIFIRHARFMATHKMTDILAKKKAYAIEKE